VEVGFTGSSPIKYSKLDN